MRTLRLLIAVVTLAMLLSLPAVAASDVPLCDPVGQAEGQTLYLCDFGVECVWDPSPGLGAGVVSCNW